MKSNMNCWEYKNCGRIPGGRKAHELGPCPVYTAKEFDKINRGMNAGRICWKVAGSFCGGKVRGTFAQKVKNCLSCDFVQVVIKEEDDSFSFL